MKKYFGTDGIRGEVNVLLTPSLAFKCANAIGKICKNPNAKVIIGSDTRKSRDLFVSSFAAGLMSAGVDVIYAGIVPTPAISYLTRHLNANFGVQITASHNPPGYNGIKIFNSDGSKLSPEQENFVERKFRRTKLLSFEKVGNFKYFPKLKNTYVNYLLSLINDRNLPGQNPSNLKIAIDCSFGATGTVAKKVFQSLYPNSVFLNTRFSGININNHCGATSPESLCQYVKSHQFDVGFAFDGDGDRIIACDEFGNVVDGDKILTVFAKNLKLANNSKVVGTILTNLGVEKHLNKAGIKLLRADVGDRCVADKIKSQNLSLGAETCGHVIIYDYAKTGDGLLCALKLCEILSSTKKSLSELTSIKLTPTTNLDCLVKNKSDIMNSEDLRNFLDHLSVKTNAKIVVRASGTEEKIRILVDSPNPKDLSLSHEIKRKIENLNAKIK